MSGSETDLAKRVAALEDIAAIKDLKIHYWQSLDRQLFDDVRECFVAKDALIDMEGIPRCTSRESFLEIAKAQSGSGGVYNMHHGHHPRISFTGTDTAEGTWESYFHGINIPAHTIIQLSGEYHDTYVRENGRWLIKSMIFKQTSFLMQTIGEDGTPKIVSLGKPDPNAFT